MEKTPKELLPEDKNARVSVAYEAETAILKGKFKKKEHRKQMGVFLECLYRLGASLCPSLQIHEYERKANPCINEVH